MALTYYRSAGFLKQLTGLDTRTGRIYLGLSTTAPTKEGTNFTEPNQNQYKGYERLVMGHKSESSSTVGTVYEMSEPSHGETHNPEYFLMHLVEYGSSGCLVKYVGLFDAKTNGNLLAFAPLTTEMEIPAVPEGGQKVVPVFDPEALVIKMDADNE